MAIKIIKQGKTGKFAKTCPDCGCEFEYEQEDVKIDSSVCLDPNKYGTYVVCPCCGKHLDHYNYIYITYPNNTNVNYIPPEREFIFTNCNNCPNRPDPKYPVTGDSPCDWCIKRQLKCDK